ncbi:MAG: response regulator [Acidobacteriota bacterium]|nr:response regulator [Acidobacteriota bacterium]
MNARSILFIGASAGDAGKIEATLRNGGAETFEWVHAEALLDGLRALQERSFDLILSEIFLPDTPGVPTVHSLQQHAPATPVIVFCHTADRDAAVNAVRKGAFDFFCHEDLDAESLRKSVEGAWLHAGSEAEKKAAAERRNNTRFPCRLAVSYQTLEQPILSGQGTSETLNISSKGLLFTSNEQFQPGQMLQVSLDWPARLENQVPLKLVAQGRIVRNANGQTAMTIDKYEFRTRRAPAPPVAAVPVAKTKSY